MTKRSVSIALVVSLAIAALFFAWPYAEKLPGFNTQTKTTIEAKPPTKPKADCGLAAHPRFLAYAKGTQPNNVGPRVVAASSKQAVAKLHRRYRTDPAYASLLAAAYRVDGYGPKGYRAHAHLYDTNHVKWCGAVRKLDRYFAHARHLHLERSHNPYNTTWFVQGANRTEVPKLRQGPIPGKASTFLVWTDRNGRVHRIRLNCGGQPSAEKFPTVPPLHKSAPQPTPQRHTPVTHTVTPHHPSVTHVVPPAPQPTHHVPPPTHTKCACITKAHASQAPLPAPKQTQPVPTKAPSAQPTLPANTSSPAPPRTGGYNGGSTQQPGATAPPSPIAEMPSDAPTQTTDPGGF